MRCCFECLTMALFVVLLMGKEERTSGEILSKFMVEETIGHR